MEGRGAPDWLTGAVPTVRSAWVGGGQGGGVVKVVWTETRRKRLIEV